MQNLVKSHAESDDESCVNSEGGDMEPEEGGATDTPSSSFVVVDHPAQSALNALQQQHRSVTAGVAAGERINRTKDNDIYKSQVIEIPEDTRARIRQGYASRIALRSSLNHYWRLSVPKMRVLLMAVGTRGDVQPFILLAKRLKKDGHRVRIASHEVFRKTVSVENGLEFYPLGGDPQVLSQFMVKTQGFIIPVTPDTIGQVPQNVIMMNEIIHSCWGACIYPDPEDPLKRPFIADAIITNPVTYGNSLQCELSCTHISISCDFLYKCILKFNVNVGHIH
jgi:hypothetical protein